MKKLTTKIVLLTLIISSIFFILPINNIAQAADPATDSNYEHYAIGWEVIPRECLDPGDSDRNCDLNSFIQLFVNLANIMLKLITPLSMIIIIYAGYQFITARGKQEQIQTGKKVLSGVFIGMLIIVIGGWVISYFVIQTLVVGSFDKDSKTTLFNSPKYIPIWKTEWWSPAGSSNSNNDNGGAISGCCVVNNTIIESMDYGCRSNTTEVECLTGSKSLKSQYQTLNGGKTFWLEKDCSDIKDPCENIKKNIKCCVTPDLDGNAQPDLCLPPAEDGCLSQPGSNPTKFECNQLSVVCDNLE